MSKPPFIPRRDVSLWAAWEKEYARSCVVDYQRNLRIFEALYEEAVALGVLPPANPLEGLEEKIYLAKRLNVSTTTRQTGSGT